jgi:hypothetical protein
VKREVALLARAVPIAGGVAMLGAAAIAIRRER